MINLNPLKELALKADIPGLIGPLDNQLALLTHKFDALPAKIGGTTAGAVAMNYIANSLLAQGATPRYATMCFTVNAQMNEEDVAELADSTRRASVEAECEIAAVYADALDSDIPSSVEIAVSGLGEQRPDTQWGANCLRPGDAVIITGAVGAHGAALAQARAGKNGADAVKSDSATLDDIVHALQNSVPAAIRCIVYPFEGFNDAVAELEEKSGTRLKIDYDKVPVAKEVVTEAKKTGVSPFDFESAGVMIVVVSADEASEALAAVKRSRYGENSALIGEVI